MASAGVEPRVFVVVFIDCLAFYDQCDCSFVEVK